MTEEVKILYSLQAEHKGLKLWLVSREIATEVRISTLILCGGKSVILDVVLGRKKQYFFRHICCFSQTLEKIVATEVLIPNSGEKCYFRSSFWEATFVLSYFSTFPLIPRM